MREDDAIDRQRELMRRVGRLAGVGLFEWYPGSRQVSASEHALQLLGVGDGGGLEPTRLWAKVDPQDRDALLQAMRALLSGGEPKRVTVRIVDGDPVEARAVVVAMESIAARDDRSAGVFGTITAAQQDGSAESKWRRMVCYDGLTGLPNRLLFREQVSYALRRAARDRSLVAVMSLDIDQFRRINETLGHELGDRMLKSLSARIARSLRSEDIIAAGEGHDRSSGVARLGGDEFAILLPRINEPQDAGRVARRLLETVSQSLELDGHTLYPSISAGIALYPWDGDDVDRLLRCADTALGRAMESGGGRAQFYSKSMNALSADRLSLENGLRTAVDQGEFVLHFQPRVDGQTAHIRSTEALIRWNHPDRGVIGPGGFIDVAEQCRLIIPIGAWVLEEACRQNHAWQRAGLPPIPVSVNISSIQFRDPGFVPVVARALELSGLAPRWLELEITESVVMNDAGDAIRIMRALKELGVRISIDDFGTGFSSLAYLKDFPVDALKIDRSFVHDVNRNSRSASITCAVIDLGARLGLEVVAEGVETEEQRRFLLEHGCREMQGFLFARPMPAPALEQHWRGGATMMAASVPETSAG